ncbi:hypothetical protein FHK02_5919 [Spirosoma sp. LMG 31448]|uniref:Transposase n=1 Tax=Spirosoma utsteinense TaxID=2585773 RepID=A0ABR6WBS7_9BACT|nr:hypothetical protein [Spirosoma utsteinense]MBC3794026.1 hypothetical protein [Spirosoma utsteinense]
MEQIFNWLRRCWVKFIHLRSTDRAQEQPTDNQSGNFFEGVVEPPVQKVYYSTPLRTYSGYIVKGSIVKAKDRRS